MAAWLIWLLVGLVLITAEVFVPGFFIACFGIAAIGTAIVTLFTNSLIIQLVVFAVVTIIVFIFVRPFAVKYLYRRGDKTTTNADALVGKTGKVVEKIDPIEGTGRVKIYGDHWKAVMEDGSKCDEGGMVEVVRTDGIKVVVKKVQ